MENSILNKIWPISKAIQGIIIFLVISLVGIMLIGCQQPLTINNELVELEGWKLIWADEFSENTLISTNWTYDIGGGGWGNHELQTYTNNIENIRIENGVLIIEAIKNETGPRKYTSARIKTQSLQAFTYGRIEASIQIPKGQGIWSAFWMLGEDFPTSGWPNSGEIDILENIGRENTIYGTIHGPGYSGGNGVGSPYYPKEILSDGFHTYAIEWSINEISWYLDDVKYNTIRSTGVPGNWVYDHPFFIILNVAVGGEWPGPPGNSTVFPQQMLVDYVRVYKSSNSETSQLDIDGQMHVDSVNLEILELEDGVRQGQIFVTILDEFGNSVEGARVKGGWLGIVRKGDSDMLTGENGVAGPFYSFKTTSNGEISFCVTAVVGGGHSYDKGENVRTCAFSD
ncbi:MAG: glycoside hydrolase family 16 protein [Chloroflexi bacterium]|jgi:beta-glucanase (GH16 family)|nr:glycoside hydrolase family 16 protein [Chloroflexota bacterium]MBT6835436.1 glycoside hydrolase family 16 protein [Bacteroidota bacterium]MBT4003504.1 glycoside hydrolase family 16 protein [Chloroflexota bacterium]MBT4305166.1 glycoside hydrolase family 16 protein [Chloroflexota bacterium]MBT4754346.1 glycoside hydrolase family 16 protein [Chloroflexota bacterium]